MAKVEGGVRGIWDSVTGALLGLIPENSLLRDPSRNPFDGVLQKGLQAGGRYADDDGRRPRDLTGRAMARGQYPDILGDATIWFPLTDGMTGPLPASTIISDTSGLSYGGGNGQLYGTVQNPGALKTQWGFAPGLNFDGTQYVPVTGGNTAGYNQQTARCCDLSTLGSQGDMLLCWGVLSHKSNPSAGTFISWGMAADALNLGGWAFGNNSNGKLVFQFTPTGAGGTTQTVLLNGDGIRGKQNDNTRSAFCFEVSASKANPAYFEVTAYIATIGTEGTVAQGVWGKSFAQMVPNGTGIVGPTPSSPLMVGAWNNTSAANRIGLMPSKSALINLGIARRPFREGLGLLICRDLRDDGGYTLPPKFPASARY